MLSRARGVTAEFVIHIRNDERKRKKKKTKKKK